MGKVVTERPRRPSWLKYNFEGRRHRFKNDLSEEAPKWEGTGKGRKSAGEYKSFDDHIRPLERYLKSKIGCYWNDVYSEVAEHLPANSMAGHHIRNQHVKQMVELNPQTHEGKYGRFVKNYVPAKDGRNTYVADGWRFQEFRYGEFYVDDDGILRRAPKVKYRYPKKEVTRKVVDGHIYEKVDGIWYEMVYETRTKQVLDSYSAYLMSRHKDGREQPPVTYRTETYEVLKHKKQLNGKELRAIGLSNQPVKK